jgi:hypothetical protein
MSVVKDIYKHLDMDMDEGNKIYSDDDLPSVHFSSSSVGGYETDVSNDFNYTSSDYDTDDAIESPITRALNVIDMTEVKNILKFVSDIISLMCRLTCNSRSTSRERRSYIEDVNELMSILEDPPECRIVMKHKAYNEILANAQIMKDKVTEIIKSF